MNKNRATKFLSILLTMCMLLGMLPMTTFADNLSDIKGHWAEGQIKAMVKDGIINGYPDGSFKPDGNISRGEFVSLIVKAFKLSEAKGKDFDDISNHWAKDFILTANAHGIVNGYSNNKFGPDNPITREEMAAMIVKVAKLVDNGKGKNFADSQDISAWAKEAVAIATSNDLITGYPDNTFKPSGNARRAEATVVLSKSLTLANLAAKVDYSLIEKSGKYGPISGNKIIKGDVVIKARDTILENLIIKGDLIIAEEVGDGDVTLNNIKVEGKTYIRGGGIDSIHINRGEYKEIIIDRTITGAVRIIATNIQGIPITITENDNGEDVILNGDIKTVTIKADGIKIITQGETIIDKVDVISGLKGVKIELSEDTQVKEIILDSKVDISGKGKIDRASGSKVRESTFERAPKTTITPSTGEDSGDGGDGGGGGYYPPTPPAIVEVSAISVSGEGGATKIATKAGTLQMIATVTPSNASKQTVTWSVYGETIATINTSGLLTAKADGTVEVTASAKDSSGVKGTTTIEISGQTVVPVDKNIKSVGTITDIDVANGTELASVGLPSIVEATLDDDSTQNLTVNWDGGNPAYAKDTAGTYEFSGTLTLPANVTNTSNLTATVKVIVAEAVVDKYVVTFSVVNGNGSIKAEVNGTEITSGTKVEQGSNLVFTATPDAGYKVKEWKQNDGTLPGTDSTLPVTGLAFAINMTVEFEATTDKYTVTYDSNTGSGDVPTDGNEYAANEEVTVAGEGSLTKENYLFDGWNTATDGSGTAYAENDTFKIAANTTLYAQWTPVVSSILINNSPTKTEYADGENLELAGLVVKVNYADNTSALIEFADFERNYLSTSFPNGQELSKTEHQTLNVYWDKGDVIANIKAYKVYYRVTFDAQGGIVSPTDALTKGISGVKLTELPRPTKTGFAFAGWFTEQTGGEQVKLDYQFTKNTTIYAQWLNSIPTIEITGVTPPVGGEKLNDSCDLPAGANYSKNSSAGWWGETENTWVTNEEAVAGQKYRFSITLKPNDGYGFEAIPDTTATINGENAILKLHGAGFVNRQVEYEFIAADPEITDFTFTATAGLQEGEDNAKAGEVAGTMSDSVGGTSPFTYSLVAGDGDDDNGKFEIVETDLKIKDNPLTEGTYKIRIQIEDSKGKKFAQAIEIIVAAKATPEQVAKPVITPSKTSADNREAGVTFSVTEVANVDFYYTLDGNTPTSSSNKYTSTVTLTAPDNDAESTITIKVIGIRSGYTDSEVAEATVTYAAKAVTPSVTSVTVTPKTASVEQGETLQLTANVVVEGGAAQTVTWTSSDINNKVQVDLTGKVIVDLDADIGEYTITATSTADNTKSDTATITVTEKAVKVTSVTLNKYELNLSVGGEETLVATVKPEDATNKNVTWESDKTNIATVDDKGKVTAVAAGNAVITVVTEDDPEVKNTCNVTVSEATGKIATFTVTGDASIVVKDKDDTEVTPSDNKYTLPEGKVTVTVTPSEGKQLKDFTVDGDKTGVEEVTVGSVYTFDMPASDVTVAVTVGEPDKSINVGGTTVNLVNGALKDSSDQAIEGLSWSYFHNTLTMDGYTGTYLAPVADNITALNIKVVGTNNTLTVENKEALSFTGGITIEGESKTDKLTIKVTGSSPNRAIYVGNQNISVKNATLDIDANLSNGSNLIYGIYGGGAKVEGGHLEVKVNKSNGSQKNAYGIRGILTLENEGTANIEAIGAEGTTRVTTHDDAPWISSASKVVAEYTEGQGDTDKPFAMTVTVPSTVAKIKSEKNPDGDGISSILVGDDAVVTLYATDGSGNKGEKLTEPIELAGGSTTFYAETSDYVWFKITVIRDEAAAPETCKVIINGDAVKGTDYTIAGADDLDAVDAGTKLTITALADIKVGGEAISKDATKEITINADTTITINKNEATFDFTVTFKDGDDVLFTQGVNSGEKATLPEEPTKDGYVFAEWQLDGKGFYFLDEDITKDITLVATWTPEDQVTTFDLVYFNSKRITIEDGDDDVTYRGVASGGVDGVFVIFLDIEKVENQFADIGSGQLKMKLGGQFLKDGSLNVVFSKKPEQGWYELAAVQQGNNMHTIINPSTMGQLNGSTDTHLAQIHLIKP